MARWSARVLRRLRKLVAKGHVVFTQKAVRELSEFELDVRDAEQRLLLLTLRDLVGRRRSSVTGEYLYVFKPVWDELVLFVKVVLRQSCVVVSFHEDRESDDGNETS